MTRASRIRRAALLVAVVLTALALACGAGQSPNAREDPVPVRDTDERIPLIDMEGVRYLGFEGGLYPGGGNVPPADHAAEGARRAAAIRPLDIVGNPDPGGRFVLLSIGMSNTSQEFCGGAIVECKSMTFGGQAMDDPTVDHATLAIVDGAIQSRSANAWVSPAAGSYDLVRDERLAPRGLSEAQVRVIWIKQANRNPTVSLPDAGADAYILEEELGDIVRALAARYPNLEQVYVSSRTYGGYSTGPPNPEPYAYEGGFAVKWLVSAQIEQARTGRVDPEAGDLAYDRAPWVAWGPYLWADGANPRSDGLVWLREDFSDDGVHPSASGKEKVGRLLLEFFKSAPTARCWFLADGQC